MPRGAASTAKFQQRLIALSEQNGDLSVTLYEYRQQGASWSTIAGILDLPLTTLRNIRHRLGFNPNRCDRIYDIRRGCRPIDRTQLAARHGYGSWFDLMYDWRIERGLTVAQVAQRLNVSIMFIRRHTPPELQGHRVNTDRNSAAARRNLALARARLDQTGRVGLTFGRALTNRSS